MKNFTQKNLFPLLLAAVLCASPAAHVRASEVETETEAETALFSCSTSRDADNNILVSFAEVQITLPADWAGKCKIITSADSAVFYHLGSYEGWASEGYEGGRLFEIRRSQYIDFLDNPSYRYIGETANGYYYIEYPTDVQGYSDDTAVMDEYLAILNSFGNADDTARIREECVISGHINADVYIMPQSATSYLTEDDLAGLSDERLQMAINEIYARRHRKFQLSDVRAYFEQQPWYDGYIEPDDFDISILNEYEMANINLMVSVVNE